MMHIWRLSDVSLSHTLGLSREQRGLGKLKLADVAHVTRDSGTTFRVKGEGWLYWQANMDIELVTGPYACMMYIVSPLAGLGGGILWQPPTYSLLWLHDLAKECRHVCILYKHFLLWTGACQPISSLPFVVVQLTLLLLLRFAPLRVRSATGCLQPPEWSVLDQVDYIGPWQPVGVEVVLYRLHPGHPRLSWWSLPIHRRLGSQDLLCIYIVVHSGDMPE